MVCLKKIFLLLMTGILMLFMSSCTSKKGDRFHSQESGDWIYTTYHCGGNCHILGLTEAGKEKTVLVVPTEIEGHPVSAFGKHIGYSYSPEIVFENCQKLYFNNYRILTKRAILSSTSEAIQIYAPEAEYLYFVDLTSNVHLYTTASISKYTDSTCEVVNIEYYTGDKLFFVDKVESGKIEVIPPLPLDLEEEKEFIGWYLGDTLWDFNNSVEDFFNSENKLILNAKWE